MHDRYSTTEHQRREQLASIYNRLAINYEPDTEIHTTFGIDQTDLLSCQPLSAAQELYLRDNAHNALHAFIGDLQGLRITTETATGGTLSALSLEPRLGTLLQIETTTLLSDTAVLAQLHKLRIEERHVAENYRFYAIDGIIVRDDILVTAAHDEAAQVTNALVHYYPHDEVLFRRFEELLQGQYKDEATLHDITATLLAEWLPITDEQHQRDQLTSILSYAAELAEAAKAARISAQALDPRTFDPQQPTLEELARVESILRSL